MSKLKSSEGKKCTSDTQSLKRDINLEENIEKLGIKAKNVNGLVNGVNHATKKDKRNKAKTTRNEAESVPSAKSSDTSVKAALIKTESTPSTSDLSETKSDKSSIELRGAKSKTKAKRTDSEKSIPSTSSKGDARSRLDDSDSSDFDISQYIKAKYGDRKDDDFEKDKLLEQIVEKPIVEVTTEATEEVPRVENPDIRYIQYESELQMPMIMKIIQKDLSEPYSIYTYRYFIHNWPNLCYLAMCEDECVGAIVCKLDVHRKLIKRGYIAMLAVDKRFRKHGIGSTLVKRAIEEMVQGKADEVVLETEITNKPALRLYEALGFVRDKRLFRYYLNGVDALRLKLWLR